MNPRYLVLIGLACMALAASLYGQVVRHDELAVGSRTVLIASDATSAQLSAYTLKAGVLEQVPLSPFANVADPQLFAVDPSKRRLYVANTDNTISGYRYDGNNQFTLEPLPGSPYSTTTLFGPFAVILDSVHELLYVSDLNVSAVTAFRIDRDSGSLKQVPGSPFTCGRGPVGMVLDKTRGFLYTANEFDGNISGFRVNFATGVLSAMPTSPYVASGQPQFLALDERHHVLYATAPPDNKLWIYSVLLDGSLLPTHNSPLTLDSALEDIILSSDGGRLYGTAYLDNSVVGYRVDFHSDSMTQVPGSPFPVGTYPLKLTFDPTEHFVYVSNALSDDISGFGVAASGELISLLSG